ncbi:hypothetical protein [Eubacterium aggregans]|uniref:hypothetical protein n=1 Tax=Eubacterium aggregans TaxID=81409 RepID=UPI003F2F640D
MKQGIFYPTGDTDAQNPPDHAAIKPEMSDLVKVHRLVGVSEDDQADDSRHHPGG